MVQQALPLPKSVADFCRRRRISRQLHAAIDLAKKSFQTTEVTLRTQEDPESGEGWIVLAVTVPAQSVRAMYRDYMSRWAELAPGPERYLIRISYDLL